MSNIAYQGVSGAYSEKATRVFFGSLIKTQGFSSFEKVFDAVLNGSCRYGVIPIENSLGGSIHTNYDLFLRYDVHILCELDFRVEHCLMTLHETKVSEIQKVFSHPQALAQCDHYCRRLHYTPMMEYDTAGSAKLLSEKKWKNAAVIASDLAAEMYDLKIVETNIEDDSTNFTRFLLLGKQPHMEKTLSNIAAPICIKTSIVFSFAEHNTTGQLYKALSAFSLRDIDLTKIESRPGNLATLALGNALVDRKKYQYLFYVDIAASVYESKVVHALANLHEFCAFVRVLGSYATQGILIGDIIQPSRADALPSLEMTSASSSRLRIGIVGFGNFGQFLAKTMALRHDVYATSRSDYSQIASSIGVTFIPNCDWKAFFEQKIDVVILAMSIPSFEKMMTQYVLPALDSFGEHAPILLVDVLSVKTHPKDILVRNTNEAYVDILCTHPMFGPESGKHSWRGLPMMFEKVRISKTALITKRFLSIFEKEHCRMIEMTCEAHDAYAASSQFITHFTGRVLAQLQLQPTPLDTTGFTSLLQLVQNTCMDSWDLFTGLYTYNPNSVLQIDQFQKALDTLRNELERITSKTPRHMNVLNPLIANMIPSKTIAVHAMTQQLLAEGKEVYSMCVGEPDYNPHDSVLQAGHEALELGLVKYTSVAGTHELRTAIAHYFTTDKKVETNVNEILVTNGGKQAVFQALWTIVTPGDEVIIPAPYWVSYPTIVTLVQGIPIFVETVVENDYQLTASALRAKITSKTKAIILCNPSNPTGAVIPLLELQAIAKMLMEPEFQHVMIVSDEIYERLVFDDVTHVCFASLPGMKHRTLVINGFSKGYAMTGFRLGYLVGPQVYIQAATTLQGQLTSCASSIAQHTALTALRGSEKIAAYETQMLTELVWKRNYVYNRLVQLPFVQCNFPKGAFYVLPDMTAYIGATTSEGEVLSDVAALCMHLLKNYQTALVPGSAFGAPTTIRIAYATSRDVLSKGLDLIEECLTSLTRAA